MLVLALLVEFGMVALFHPAVALVALHAGFATGVLDGLEFFVEAPEGALFRLSY